MPGLSSVFVVIAVTACTFAIMAVLVSHLRYQHWLYEAEELASSVCTPDAASLLILDHLRRAPLGIIRIRLPESAETSHSELLSAQVRKTDRVLRMTTGELWVLLNLEPEHLPSVANRLSSRMQSEGIEQGSVTLFYPDPTLESVAACTEPPLPEVTAQGWRQEPEIWPYEDEELPVPASTFIDPLTGTLAETSAPRAFRGILAVHRRKNTPVSALRVDVDQLKEYNRGPGGEQAGDAVLKQVASELMAHCREDDLVARLDGDEFLICIQQDAETALIAAQRMSEAIKHSHVDLEGQKLRFTVSIGIAAFPAHGETPRALFHGAGLACYAAASRGRGSCMIFTQDMRPAPVARAQSESSPESF